RPPVDPLHAGTTAPNAETGAGLLRTRLVTKELAFPADERVAFGLRGLLPAKVFTLDEQVALEIERLRRKSDDLERYVGLAALQDRNATLFYRVLRDHLEELLPIVYTPTVGRACIEFSHILRRARGIWITPDQLDDLPAVLRAAPYDDVRLIVATDNERILGLGDLGAGGMGIPIGKLALYTAGGGIHPSLTLPVSLDVGTDNAALLADPYYIGYRAPRLRGAEYLAVVDAFVRAIAEVWPGCVIQWEDLKGANALAVLERHRETVPSFNDDIEGTAAVTVAAVLAAARALGTSPTRWRFVLHGAGAAGTGIAHLLRLLLADLGADPDTIARAIVTLDSRGLVHEGRTDLDAMKRRVALPQALAAELGLATGPAGLAQVIAAVRPDVLIGTTGTRGAFDPISLRVLAAGTERPVVLPLSNPTALAEATPAEILAATSGRALVATGSPFPPVPGADGARVVAQANNVFVFPGVGLGLVAAEAVRVTDAMLLAAARAVADAVDADRLAAGGILPPVDALPAVSRAVAIAVAEAAIAAGVSPLPAETDVAALIDAATWTPAYVPYVVAPGA
ncbi:MAG: oxaloacetate-decarboxylating malate dehydrogenase, partial [Chloroflexota bacterium]